jgi:type IV secretory pathway VirD2 relaxase
VKLTAHGAAAAALHLRYIQRDGVERDGSPGVLYDPEGPVPASTFEQPRVGEKHQFRFIVSPEDADDLDLTDYVRRLMRQVEKDTRQPLEWAAVNHYNTDHPHAHVVVRGVDRRGQEVRFDRDYIARGIRDRAQEIATQELGARSPEEIARTRQREVTQERWTSLDQELERRAKGGRLSRADLETPGRTGARPPPLVARLEHLEQLRLAERVASGSWALSADWKERLRELGERGDIVKQMHKAVGGDTARYRHVRPGQPLDPHAPPDRVAAPVLGRIRAKALADEARGTFCAIVEAPDGTAYHVPLDPRTAASCRVGDCVTLSTVTRIRARPEDALLEAMARRAGGICAPRSEDPARANLEQRLRQLEALGLTRREPSGGWRLEANLGKALERLDHERPEYRLLVRLDGRPLADQVKTRGPVWLDRVDPSTLAPDGLGAELRARVDERAQALRAFGIDLNDPRKVARLRDLERRTVGERAAARAGQAFQPSTPAHFQGHLAAADVPGYAVVSDGRQLVVVSMTRELRAHVGHTVVLERDATGKLRPQLRPLDRGS